MVIPVVATTTEIIEDDDRDATEKILKKQQLLLRGAGRGGRWFLLMVAVANNISPYNCHHDHDHQNKKKKSHRNIFLRLVLAIMIYFQFYMSTFVLHRKAFLSSYPPPPPSPSSESSESSTTTTTATETTMTSIRNNDNDEYHNNNNNKIIMSTTSQSQSPPPPPPPPSSSSSSAAAAAVLNLLESPPPPPHLSLLPTNATTTTTTTTTKAPPTTIVHASNPSIASSSSSLTIPTTTSSKNPSSSSSSCLNRDGIIILNGMGRLANNIFEFAYAKRLSEQLCWPILFRKDNDVAPLTTDKMKGLNCFPNANLHNSIESGNYDNVVYNNNNNTSSYQQLFNKLNLTKDRWMGYYLKGRYANQKYSDYMSNLSNENGSKVFTIDHIRNVQHYIKSHGPGRLKKYVQQHTNIQVIELKGYFVKSDWMIVGSKWPNLIQNWFGNINQQLCCPTEVPNNAVVLHFRDFGGKWETRKEDGINLEQGITVNAYIDILEKYNYLDNNRPLWIVCQPKSINSEFIQSIKEYYYYSKINRSNNNSSSSSSSSDLQQVKVVTGVDQYDALCILMKSQTLILSSASTFSQIGAFLHAPTNTTTTNNNNNNNNNNSNGTIISTSTTFQQQRRVVHYPITTLNMPHVTINIPEWKYHLINISTTPNKIDEFDIQPHDRIKFK